MRKTKTITIPGARREGEQGSRDNGKTFLLTEMHAYAAERWANRAALALAHSRVNFATDFGAGGMSALAAFVATVGHVDFAELAPLDAELFTCVQVVPDPARPQFARALQYAGDENDDVEEVATARLLRAEVIALHTNFLLAAAIFNSIVAATEMTSLLESSPPTLTSRRRSRRSSGDVSPPSTS